ncbi:MAG: small ribosomal subunit Rsm22 family protein [Desulfovibrio sp.]|jgi:hypothetical protein|nr:small ribosomal subunit Rsm22 family protein [Desulfovibrio sp.]
MRQLFPPLSAQTVKVLELLPEALARVRPLKRAHKRSLPEDVAALSRMLTVERRERQRPYWSSPAFVSAYLYYFLPWNLLRQTRLLSSLPLPDPRLNAPQGEALLLDAGSGPLTLPIALWLARPEWEEAPVRVLAVDSANQPLELGMALFSALGELLGRKPWPVRAARGPLEHLPRLARQTAARGGRATPPRPWLVAAANVLNEAGRHFHEGGGMDESLERLAEIFTVISPSALLFIEPGTRLGGKTIMRLRESARQNGFGAASPCTHNSPCPLLAGDGGKTWCHFTFDTQGAPSWLTRLSNEAGLTKNALSLSPLLLLPQAQKQAGGAEVRVISAPFSVPGLAGLARYACSAGGLLLLEDAGRAASGEALSVRADKNAPRDKKSRARVVHSDSG